MPARKLNIRKTEKYIPGDFLKQLYEAVDNLRDLAYIKFHAETGLRISDVIQAEVKNIEWDHNRILVWDEKKDEWRTVHFPPSVGSTLKIYLNHRNAGNGKDRRLFPFSEKTANNIIKRWCVKLGFRYGDKVSSHWLRHTFIRLSRRAGRDIKAVQQNTGDDIQTIMKWYEGLTDDEMETEISGKPLVR